MGFFTRPASFFLPALQRIETGLLRLSSSFAIGYVGEK